MLILIDGAISRKTSMPNRLKSPENGETYGLKPATCIGQACPVRRLSASSLNAEQTKQAVRRYKAAKRRAVEF